MAFGKKTARQRVETEKERESEVEQLSNEYDNIEEEYDQQEEEVFVSSQSQGEGSPKNGGKPLLDEVTFITKVNWEKNPRGSKKWQCNHCKKT